jgi:hypothetical protein
MGNLLSEEVKITQVVDQSEGAAGATDINGDGVDMNGFEGVMFVAIMGPITSGAVTSLKAQQDTASDFSDDAQDLAGTGITIADDDDEQVFVLDIWRPLDRYVRPVIERATQNATVQSVLAVQYGPRELPTEFAVADLINYEAHVSPAEGTA